MGIRKKRKKSPSPGQGHDRFQTLKGRNPNIVAPEPQRSQRVNQDVIMTDHLQGTGLCLPLVGRIEQNEEAQGLHQDGPHLKWQRKLDAGQGRSLEEEGIALFPGLAQRPEDLGPGPHAVVIAQDLGQLEEQDIHAQDQSNLFLDGRIGAQDHGPDLYGEEDTQGLALERGHLFLGRGGPGLDLSEKQGEHAQDPLWSLNDLDPNWEETEDPDQDPFVKDQVQEAQNVELSLGPLNAPGPLCHILLQSLKGDQNLGALIAQSQNQYLLSDVKDQSHGHPHIIQSLNPQN